MPSVLERLGFFLLRMAYSKQVPAESDGSWVLSRVRGAEPPRRGTKELMTAYRRMPWLRAVAGRIADAVAATPWQLFVVEGSNGRAVRNRVLQKADLRIRRQKMAELKQQGALREIEEHPLLDLLDRANPLMTGRTARKVTQLYLDLKGETFWVIERNGAGMPVEYWPIPPHWVVETPEPGRPTFRVNFPSWQGEIPATEIVWLKDPDPENPYGRGAGLAEALGDELDTDEYASKHVKAWFYNRAVPELLIGVENASEEELRAAKAKWEAEHRSFWRAFRTHFYSGKLEVHQLSQSFQDQQLVPLRQFERDTIQQVFGIPPEILGILENSNRATIDSADYLFARWVIVPRLELLRSEMQERLVPEFDDRLILDYVSPVPEDRQFKLEVAKSAPWALKRNEWRALMEMEPDESPSGDVYLVPINLIPERSGEELVGRPAEEPAAPPEGGEEESGSPAVSKVRPRRKIREDDLDNILEALRPEYLTQELDPIFRELVEKWGSRILDELGAQSSFNMLNPLVTRHLEEKQMKIKDVNETTKNALRDTLREGIRAGESIPELADRVSEVFQDAKGRRAVMIARTEVLQSSNFATWQAHVQSGVVDKREWIATPDSRTRDAHRALDGQIQAINNPFVVPPGAPHAGATAMYPGGFGIAELDVQCRCTTAAVVDDSEEESISDEERRLQIWKQFDRELIPWERRVENALKRGFQAQQNAVMRVLNQLAGRE